MNSLLIYFLCKNVHFWAMCKSSPTRLNKWNPLGRIVHASLVTSTHAVSCWFDSKQEAILGHLECSIIVEHLFYNPRDGHEPFT